VCASILRQSVALTTTSSHSKLSWNFTIPSGFVRIGNFVVPARETSMRYVAICTAAILVSGVVAADAQSSGAGVSGTERSQTQCWDTSSNTVKNQAPGADMTGAKNQSTTGIAAGGSPASSNSPANSPAGATGKGTSPEGLAAASARPAGMPNC
jgi:hypothetical protein